MKLLSNDRITLRALEPTDLDTIHKWENDTDLWAVGGTIAPFSRHQIWEYLQNYTANIYEQNQLRLMIVLNETNASVGLFDIFDFDAFHRRAFLGMLIDKVYANQGIGQDALTVAMNYLQNFIGLHQVVVHIPANNLPCLRLFDKNKFERTGILKDWLRTNDIYTDVVVMQYVFK